MGGLFLLAWYGIYAVQVFMAYGTAYRYTKNGGDNGVALFGWMLAFVLAAMIPGLGIYLWKQSKELEQDNYRGSTQSYGNSYGGNEIIRNELNNNLENSKSTSKNTLIDSGLAYLKKGEWEKADAIFELALEKEPDNPKIYVGRLCADVQTKTERDLLTLEIPIVDNENYKKALLFADDEYRKTLQWYATPAEQRKIDLATNEMQLYHALKNKIEDVRSNKIKEEYSSLISELNELEQTACDESIIHLIRETRTPTIISEDEILCPICNCSQKSDRRVCWKCSNKFIFT